MPSRGLLLFAGMSLFWGIPYFFIKISVAELDPVVVVFARVGIAALILLPVAMYRRVLHQLRGHLGAVCVLALVQLIGPFLLITYGELFLSSAMTSLLIAAEPLVVVLLALRFDRAEQVTGLRLFGLLVGLVGVASLLGFDLGISGESGQLLGAGMVLLAAAGYAASALVVKREPFASLPPLGVVTAECAVATVVLTIPAGLRMPGHMPGLDVLGSLVVLGVVCTALAWLTFFALVATLGAARGTVFAYVNPAVAVVFGVLLLDEPFTVSTGVGFVLILIGSWLSTRASRPSARAEPPPAGPTVAVLDARDRD